MSFMKLLDDLYNQSTSTTSEENHTITLVVPGYKKDSFTITTEEDSLSIKATPTEETPHATAINKTYYYHAGTVDTKKVSATYTSGILTVTLPFSKSKKRSGKVLVQ